jgi:hypothetical protein
VPLQVMLTVVSCCACAVPPGVPGISQLLANSLWQWVVRPLLLRPLMQAGAQQQAAGVAAPAAAGVAPGHLRRNSGGRGLAAGTPVGSPKPSGHWSWGSGSWGTGGLHVQAATQACTQQAAAVGWSRLLRESSMFSECRWLGKGPSRHVLTVCVVCACLFPCVHTQMLGGSQGQPG